jgi:hypothetical protein
MRNLGIFGLNQNLRTGGQDSKKHFDYFVSISPINCLLLISAQTQHTRKQFFYVNQGKILCWEWFSLVLCS